MMITTSIPGMIFTSIAAIPLCKVISHTIKATNLDISTKKNKKVYRGGKYMADISLEINRIFLENINDESKLIFNLDSNLSDLNIDSITFIKIIVSIEGAFDFEFDDEMLLFTAFPTVKSMVEYVESKVFVSLENYL